MSLSAPVALVIQPSPLQAHLWSQALTSQGLMVVMESPRDELMSFVHVHQPDLLVVDMTTGLFNPYAFCRECRSQYPSLPVILTHQAEYSVEPAARRWAIYQGAADVMPGLSRTVEVLDYLYQVLTLMGLGSQFNDQALLQALNISAPSPVADFTPAASAPDNAPVGSSAPVMTPERPVSAGRSQRMFRGRPVG